MTSDPFGPSSRFVLSLLVCALFSVTPSDAFVRTPRASQSSSFPNALRVVDARLFLNIGGWFGRGGDKKRSVDNDTENLGGVASIVDSMGDLKTAQRVGQLTDSLVKDLSTTIVEGTAMDGKVKVSFDCQQKPVGVTMDENMLSEVDATTLSSALTAAMQDAHSKSIERMDEKMKSLYTELGLAAAS